MWFRPHGMDRVVVCSSFQDTACRWPVVDTYPEENLCLRTPRKPLPTSPIPMATVRWKAPPALSAYAAARAEVRRLSVGEDCTLSVKV